MYAVTRRLDAPAPVLVDCDYSGGGNRREREGNAVWKLHPNAVAWFGAHAVAHRLDVVDRAVLQRERVRVHDVSKRFESLFDERLVGTRF